MTDAVASPGAAPRAWPRRARAWVGIAAALVALYFVLPSQFGGKTTYIVVKGVSMRPDYVTGDIVVVRPADSYEVGDVVVYAVPDGEVGAGDLVMHRIIAIAADGRYVIQGDNRDEPDDFEIYDDDVVGKQRLHIPHVAIIAGIVLRWWVIGAIVGLAFLYWWWPDDADDEADEAGEAAGDQVGEAATLDADVVEQASSLPPPTGEPAPVPAPVVETSLASEPPEPARPEPEPARPAWRAAPLAVVDGDGLARAGWATLGLERSRQECVAACDAVAARFGTRVAVVFESGEFGTLDTSGLPRVDVVTDGRTVGDVLRPAGAGEHGLTGVVVTSLVVTDVDELADEVRAKGATTMTCARFLSLADG